MRKSAWMCIVPPLSTPDIRLFCFAHAGGGASAYRVWRKLLPRSVELVAVQLPGRENRYGEKLFTNLMELVDVMLGEFDSFTDLPFAFFGHSLGALLAFEVAKGLRRENMPLPRHLFVSGRGAPHIELPRKERHKLTDDELISEVLRLDSDSRTLLENPDLVKVVLPVLRADFALHDTYCYVDAPPFNVPVTAYCGRSDEAYVVENIGAWRRHTTRKFSVHLYEGNHFYLRDHKEYLIADIKKAIYGVGCEVECLAP